MKTIRLALLIALVAFYPARAYALEGWWDWLDALSGPGPYHGYGFGHTFCVPGRPGTSIPCWKEFGTSRSNRLDQALEARVTLLLNYGERFEDDPEDDGTVRVWAFEGFYLFRLGGRFHIDVGPGVGLLRFSGRERSSDEPYDALYRFTISPVSFSFAPLAPKGEEWSRLRLRVDSMYVPEGFSGDQFGNTITNFETGGEFLTKLSIIFRF